MHTPLVLASASPRRRELLEAAGIAFRVEVSRAAEAETRDDSPGHLVRENALEKACEVAGRVDADFVIGADTVVVLDGDVLGKPADMADAAGMLRRLAGREHEVLTGVAVVPRGGEPQTDLARTIVRFGPLPEATLRAYMDAFNPLDKAGAYAVQGPGALVIEEIRGCYYNVVGLPLNTLERLFNDLGRSLLRDAAFRSSSA